MKARSTGITIALTLALAVALSFAPVPDAFKPFPTLTRGPLQDAIAALLLPERGGARAQEVMTGEPLVADESDEEVEAAREAAEAEAVAENTVPAPTPAATLGAPGFRSVRHLEKLAQTVGAKHVEIEAPDALERFFSKVESVQRGERDRPVRIVQLGDSQIASDHITDLVRERLQLRYGSGGRGFLFVDRPTKFSGRKVRTGEATPGWQIALLTDKTRTGVFGFSGARFKASKSLETTEFELGDARTAEVFFATDPKGGLLEILADGKPVSQILTQLGDPEMAFSRVRLPAGARTLRLASADGDVSLFGVSLENGAPGIVYDTVGLPGALYEVYLRAPERMFSAQLARRDPALVVLMLGGNEAYEVGRGWSTLDKVRTNASNLVDRIKAAAPEADCLLLSPMDAGIRTVGGEIEPRPHTREVGNIIREVALAKGCAYWDVLAAMGGIGSVPKWLDAGLFHTDLVHPRAQGADLIGHLFDFALERARSARPGAWNAAGADALGLVTPTTAPLARTWQKLAALQSRPKEAEAVRIVQLGASHTAGHMFTDVAREQLARAFGATAGRGFIAAGRASPRLGASGVRRSLEGEWQVSDAREEGPGEAWGLTGIRAVGSPGAKLSIEFGVDRPRGTEPARLSLYYLETPGMGRMEVRVDGKLQPGDVQKASVTSEAEVRVRAIPVSGLSHALEVTNAGGGPIVIFGASLDLDRGGIVYDALGLPGSTAELADGYDKAAFRAQLRERQADLYVLFYGTNESALPDFDPVGYSEHYASLLRTLREASPSAECVILGPTDRVPAVSIDTVVRTLRELATQEGCAFWSPRAAMGGPFAMRRWQSLSPPLGHPDGVHLTQEGYRALALAFVDDLLAGYRSR